MTVRTAVIVDDERLARVNLMRLLEKYQDIRVVGEAESCKEAVQVIEQRNPQILFLDIQLIGETGFDLLPMIKMDPYPTIIFVTAYDEHAVRAFEINALDYLLKPVNPERLAQTIVRIRQDRSYRADPGILNYSDSLFLKTDVNISRFIDIASILSITPVGNHSEITLKDGSKVVVLKTLKLWENELPNNHFLRIHKSAIINQQYIDRVEKISASEHLLYLKYSETPYPVSRRQMRNLNILKRPSMRDDF